MCISMVFVKSFVQPSFPPFSRPPLLCEYHQKGALSLMTNSHLNLMDDLCLVFQLHSANTDLLIDLVHNLLAEGKRKEVCGNYVMLLLQSEAVSSSNLIVRLYVHRKSEM